MGVKNNFLLLTVFITGMSIMAVEMSASRLLAPYFGTSLFVWTNIIGVIMIALSLGYYLGGRIADKYHSNKLLYKIIFFTGIFIGLIPFIAQPVMQMSVKAINIQDFSLFYASLFVTILLFGLPLIMLGMISPYVIRLVSKTISTVGNTAGSVYSLSTVGSIIGTFIPALLTIPFIGTKNTIILFSIVLIILSIIGLRIKSLSIFPVLFFIFLFVALPIKPAEGVVYDTESVYNYIRVIDQGGIRYLQLNEGHAIHSMYDPSSMFVRRYWGYFNVLPILNNKSKDVLMIGHAAGTMSKQYGYFFPHLQIDGVEIDPKITEIGVRFFAMNETNLKIYNMDGRTFLYASDKKYDIITADAYKQPYIPFHLTTKEFFEEVQRHLNEGGILAINVGAVDEKSEIYKMIINTLKVVYKNVYSIKVRTSLNFIVLATDHDYNLKDLLEYEGNPDLEYLAKEVALRYKELEFDDDFIVLTDDRAPVEIYTDKMIYDYAQK